MKNRVILVWIVLLIFGGVTMFGEGTVPNDADKVYVEPGIGNATVKWEIVDNPEIEGFEITARGETTTYKKPKTISKDKREFVLEKLEPLDYVSIKLRVLGKNGERSKGIGEKVMIKHKNVVPDEFNGKRMFVYLPDGYYESNEKYPVMYMLDGQNIFSTAYAPTEWGVDEAVDKLVKEGKIRKVIVVGIFHAGDKRTDEYTAYEYQRGKDFADKLAKEYTAYIEGKYKALSGKENRGIMGSSRAGLMSLYMINNYSDYFGFCGAVSPSEKWKFREYKNFQKKDVKIWVDNGTADYVLGYARSEACRIMVDGYLAQGHKYGDSLAFYEVKESIHNEMDWAKRVEFPFVMFAGRADKKVIDFTIFPEVFHNLEGKAVAAINPVADFTNGIRYSLYNQAKYSVTGKAQIDDKGILQMNGEKVVTVKVEYEGIVKEIAVTADDIEKMTVANRGAM